MSRSFQFTSLEYVPEVDDDDDDHKPMRILKLRPKRLRISTSSVERTVTSSDMWITVQAPQGLGEEVFTSLALPQLVAQASRLLSKTVSQRPLFTRRHTPSVAWRMKRGSKLFKLP